MSEYKLFVGTACPHCRKVENFMEENNIEIQIVNINENRDAMKELIEKIVSFMSVSCMSCNMVCLFRSGNRLNIYGIYFT